MMIIVKKKCQLFTKHAMQFAFAYKKKAQKFVGTIQKAHWTIRFFFVTKIGVFIAL